MADPVSNQGNAVWGFAIAIVGGAFTAFGAWLTARSNRAQKAMEAATTLENEDKRRITDAQKFIQESMSAMYIVSQSEVNMLKQELEATRNALLNEQRERIHLEEALSETRLELKHAMQELAQFKGEVRSNTHRLEAVEKDIRKDEIL